MTSLPPPTTAPAGWYADPEGPGWRYFDGRAWAPRSTVVDTPEHPSLPMHAALGALAVLVASLIVGKILVDVLITFDWPLLVYVVILAAVGYGPSLAWCWYVRRRWAGGRLAALGWRFRWVDLGWGAITWMAAIATQIAVAAVILVLDIPLSSNVDRISEVEADKVYLVATALTAVIAAPVVEELVFRGLVLRGLLSRIGPVLAVLVQGLLFGIAHVDPVRGVGNIGLALVLSGVGVAFGVSAYLTRRLGPTVIAHAIFNGVVLAILLSGVVDRVDSDFDLRSPASAVVAGLDGEQPVVDQPHVAEPGGGEHDRV